MIQIKHTFDCFLVNNSFVDNYMCEANGSFIKVYLYLLRHASNSNLEINTIANALNLRESDVIRAFKYWSKKGVLEYVQTADKDFSLAITDGEHSKENIVVQENEKIEEKTPVKPQSAPSGVSYTKSDIITYMKNNDGIRHMFLISEQLLGKTLTDTDKKILFGFYDYLSLPVEVIFTLLEYCISIGKTNMRYIEKVAYTWADKGINTLSKASAYVKEENEINNIFRKYKSLFKITGRELTNTEEEHIKSWVFELKLSDDAIVNAYEKTVANTGKISFKYMDAILRNSSSVHQVKTTPLDKNKANDKKNFFQDYDDELSEFEINMIKNRLNG